MRIIRNGTRLNGFGEQIMDGEADLSVVAISWTPTRAEKLHFLPPIGYSEYDFHDFRIFFSTACKI